MSCSARRAHAFGAKRSSARSAASASGSPRHHAHWLRAMAHASAGAAACGQVVGPRPRPPRAPRRSAGGASRHATPRVRSPAALRRRPRRSPTGPATATRSGARLHSCAGWRPRTRPASSYTPSCGHELAAIDHAAQRHPGRALRDPEEPAPAHRRAPASRGGCIPSSRLATTDRGVSGRSSRRYYVLPSSVAEV